MGPEKLLLIIGLLCTLTRCDSRIDCKNGEQRNGRKCVDVDECEVSEDTGSRPICGKDSNCINTYGSYYCQCQKGFNHSGGQVNFTTEGECKDINECDKKICGPHASCNNTMGNYTCTTCQSGYHANRKGLNCTDINECEDEDEVKPCGEKGDCINSVGSYLCVCSPGYSNYGNEKTPCSELQCDQFDTGTQSSSGLSKIFSLMQNNCNAMSKGKRSDGDTLLEMFTEVEAVMKSPDNFDSTDKVTELLEVVEDAMKLIGPQLEGDQTHPLETSQTEAKLAVRKGKTPPTGPINLTTEDASLDTDWQTASGANGTHMYPGFALAALVSYKNLETSVNRSFENLRGHQNEDGVDPDYQINSKVVSAVVSNPSTEHLDKPVSLTLKHLQDE